MKLDTILSKAFRSDDAALAFAHFLPLAGDIVVPKRGVFRRNATLALHNVDHAVASVIDRLPELARQLPTVDVVAVAELPSLALAVVHAAARVPSALPSARAIDARLAANRPMRVDTLAYLEIAARRGLIPAGRVRAIRAGKGRLDEASDALAIVALFREYEEALANTRFFTEESLQTFAENGTWLVRAIKPSNLMLAAAAKRSPEALDRDRLVALLQTRYDQLRTVGVFCFGLRNVDANVPPLWSAARGVSAPAAAAPAPTPTPVT